MENNTASCIRVACWSKYCGSCA